MIHHKAFPRAAVVGNPSDGYHGKTIAFVFNNFETNVYIEPSEQLEIVSDSAPSIIFENTEDLNSVIQTNGYKHSKVKNHLLVCATIRYFLKHFSQTADQIKPTFKINYTSSIPISVGLAGSSAIVTATFKSILEFNNFHIDSNLLANHVLSVEKEELNIEAGLQDRVAQVFGEPTFMDFNKAFMETNGYGIYEYIDGLENIPFYIAYPTQLSESSGIVHNDLRQRYDNGDLQVKLAMEAFGGLTSTFRETLQQGNIHALNAIINRNYDIRKSIMKINPAFDLMIQLARNIGVSAKFTGSGGALIGIYKNQAQFLELKTIMAEHDIEVIQPQIVRRK